MDIEEAKASLRRTLGVAADLLLANLGTDVIRIDEAIAALSVVRKATAEIYSEQLRLTQSVWPYDLLKPAEKVNVTWTAEDRSAGVSFELVYNFGKRTYAIRDDGDQSRPEEVTAQKIYALLPEHEIARVKHIQAQFDLRAKQAEPKLQKVK